MVALVVFEWMFGNTRQIADAVTEGLAEHLPVELVEVGTAPAAIGHDVEGTTGPLVPGERERARRWGVELAVRLGAARPSQRQVP
jgi:hypothetical protein